MACGGAADEIEYTWATNKEWGGTCRQLSLKFTDGQVFTADFQFRQ
jgi:hypothetical protein